MNQPIRLYGHRLLQISRGLSPTGGLKKRAAEKRFRKQTLHAAKSHDLCIPHAHHMQRARVAGLQLNRTQRLCANLTCISHAIARAERKCGAAQCARKMKMRICVLIVQRNGTSCVVGRACVQRRSARGIQFHFSDIDSFARRFPQCRESPRIEFDRRLVVIERGGTMSGQTFLVAQSHLFRRRLSTRRCEGGNCEQRARREMQKQRSALLQSPKTWG